MDEWLSGTVFKSQMLLLLLAAGPCSDCSVQTDGRTDGPTEQQPGPEVEMILPWMDC